MKIWSPFTGELIRNLNGHTKGLSDIAWSPDSVYLASASDDHTIRIWDVDSVRMRTMVYTVYDSNFSTGTYDKSVEGTLKLCVLRKLQYAADTHRIGRLRR